MRQANRPVLRVSERNVRIISIINQKGGCGKTTTAINLAGVFAERGLRTLLVDMDPQSHCAAGLAIPEQRIDLHIGDAMLALPDRPVDPARLLWRVSRNLDLAPSTMKLAALEATRGDLAGQADPERRLGRALAPLAADHDICLIDCSPAIGLLAFNAMAAASEIIVPVETGFFSLQGASKQVSTIKAVGKRLGMTPMYRLLATMHDPASVLAADLLEELRRRFPGKVLPVVIRHNQSLREAASFGQPVIEYAPDSAGSEDYRALAQYLIDHTPAPGKAETEPADAPRWGREQPANAEPQPTAPTGAPAPAVVQIVPGVAERAMMTAIRLPPFSPPAAREPVVSEGASAPAPDPPRTEPPEPLIALAAPTEPVSETAPSDAPGVRAADLADRARRLQQRTPESDLSPRTDPADTAVPLRPHPALVLLANEPAPPPVPEVKLTGGRAPSLSHVLGVRPTPQGWLFVQPASLGRSVSIAGDFNNWSGTAIPMRLNEAMGVFEACVHLPPGLHMYRLVVDGARWIADPHNPVVASNSFGEPNSVVLVPHTSPTALGMAEQA